MRKYTEQQKLAVVEDYCSGTAGIKAVAERHSIGASSLRKWAACYREHGAAGVQTKSRIFYSAEFKLSVLLRKRNEELSFRQAAALFNIRNFNIIRNWELAYDEGGISALVPHAGLKRKIVKSPPSEPHPVLPSADKLTREELLAELNQLRMENAYLKKLDALVQENRSTAQQRRR